LLSRIPKLKVTAVLIMFLAVFFYAPIVPYMQGATVPGSFTAGYTHCIAGISQTNLTLADEQRVGCENEYRAAPATLYGFATPAYSLFAYGSPPYPSQMLVSQGNHSALVFFNLTKAVALEDVGGPGVQIEPPDLVWVQDAEVTSFDYGFLNITIRVTNVGLHPISNGAVYLSMKGYSTNSTLGGLVLIQPKLVGDCPASLPPAALCTVSQVTPNVFPINESINFYPEVRGSVGITPFVYRQGFAEGYPTGGVGPIWVQTFMAHVDQDRGAYLTENATLDDFAAARFKQASSVYQISDYNFVPDALQRFGEAKAAQVAEELLYPGIFSPNTYPTFLSNYAFGHWDTLMNRRYAQFGYYVGRGLYYDVSIPCRLYEVPGPGINITQFFQKEGCSTTVVTATWLVIILGP
jgi:hypothetical protein